jgi:hypothetical protein
VPPSVELIYFTGCPHVEQTRAVLRVALSSCGLPALWEEWDQHSAAAPQRVQGYASPTVLVAGRDVTGTEPSSRAFPCCSIRGPSVEMIRAAVVEMRREGARQ